ncbi:MAG: transcriptional antiterminator, partial [Bdellovibrionota bacterium]
MDSYRPIPCSIHDVLEAAVVRRKKLRLVLKETVVEPARALEIEPLDVTTEGGAEFLLYRVAGSGLEARVRLDL